MLRQLLHSKDVGLDSGGVSYFTSLYLYHSNIFLINIISDVTTTLKLQYQEVRESQHGIAVLSFPINKP